MTLLCKAVVANLGVGAAATTKLITGVGFQPKVVFAFCTNRGEAVDTVAQGTSMRSYGFGALDGGVIAQRSAATFSTHGVAAGTLNKEHSRMQNDGLILAITNAGNIDGQAALTSFNADGCLLTILNQFPTDLRVIFLFYGGTDITDCAIGTVTGPIAGTPPFTSDITGFGFSPVVGHAVGFLMGCTTFNDNDNAVDSDLSFGAFVRSTQRGFLLAGSDNAHAAVSQSISACHGSEVMNNPNTALSIINRRVDFTDFIADGMRLTYNEVSTEAVIFHYLVINGGKWAVKPLNTANTLVDCVLGGVGIGPPVGGLIFSAMQLENTVDTFSSDQKSSVGVFSGPASRYCIAENQQDNVATTVVATAIEHAAAYAHISAAGAVVGLMDVKTMDTDGVTFTMDDADDFANYCFVVLAAPESGGGSPGPLTQDVTIPLSVETLNDLYLGVLSKGHTIGDPYATVTDNDTTGNPWTKIAEVGTDRKATLWWKKATGQTAGKKVTVAGGITSMACVLSDFSGTWLGGAIPHTVPQAIALGGGRSIFPGLTPDYTDSMIVAVIMYTDSSVPVGNIDCADPGTLTKAIVYTPAVLTDAGGLIAYAPQNAGPKPTGPLGWSQAGAAQDYAFLFAIRPRPGEGTSWTTTTKVDSGGEGAIVDREVFGTIAGTSFTLEPAVFEYGGFHLSKVYGSDTDMITLDRIAVIATVETIATVGISFTFDGGLTYTPEVIVTLQPSANGEQHNTGWQPVTGRLFQIRTRPLSGNATIHRIIIHAQPRGRAV